jgi:hypothetical protein
MAPLSLSTIESDAGEAKSKRLQQGKEPSGALSAGVAAEVEQVTEQVTIQDPPIFGVKRLVAIHTLRRAQSR